MAYFPNGTSGEIYLEDWCFQCKNWQQRKDEDGTGCPIMDVHFMFGYSERTRDILNALIPMDKEGIYPLQCRMYDWNGECRDQMTFEEKPK